MRQDTTLKKLLKKSKRLERKFEKIPEECVLDRTRIMKSYVANEAKIKAVKKAIAKAMGIDPKLLDKENANEQQEQGQERVGE